MNTLILNHYDIDIFKFKIEKKRIVIKNQVCGALLCEYAKPKHLIQVEELLYSKVEEIRPQLLNIVEAYVSPISDTGLNSVLGASDGRTYEYLFNAAACNPLNWKDKLCKAKAFNSSWGTPLFQSRRNQTTTFKYCWSLCFSNQWYRFKQCAWGFRWKNLRVSIQRCCMQST